MKILCPCVKLVVSTVCTIKCAQNLPTLSRHSEPCFKIYWSCILCLCLSMQKEHKPLFIDTRVVKKPETSLNYDASKYGLSLWYTPSFLLYRVIILLKYGWKRLQPSALFLVVFITYLHKLTPVFQRSRQRRQ